LQTFKQAAKFAPEDMPTRSPSSLASLLAFAIASSVVTVTASSITEVSSTSGINPGPIPWILCLPGSPPEGQQYYVITIQCANRLLVLLSAENFALWSPKLCSLFGWWFFWLILTDSIVFYERE
jgi:hypothetical protein